MTTRQTPTSDLTPATDARPRRSPGHRLRRDRRRRRPQRARRRRRTWPGPASGSSSSSAATASAGSPTPSSSRPASARRPSPTPSGGCARRSCASSACAATACRSSRPTSGSSRRSPTAARSPCAPIRRRPPRACARWSAHDAERYVGFDGLVRSLGRFLAELNAADAARRQGAGPRRRAGRAAARADVPRPRPGRRPVDPPRPADGDRRLRRRVVRDRRAPRRARRRGASTTPRWARGRPARRPCFLDRLGRQRRRGGRPDGLRPGRSRGARRRRSRRRSARAGGEIRTGAEVAAITTGRRPGDRRAARLGRGDRRPGSSSPAPIPKRVLTDAARPGRRRAGHALAGRATSGRRARSRRSTSPCAGCPASPPPATDPRRSGCSAAGS